MKKEKVLIVDDSEMNRSILADMLGEEFEILEAEDGLKAINIIKQNGSGISVILLDIVMPNMDGFDVLATMNAYHWIEDIPVIMITAESGSSYVERAYTLGATDLIKRPFDTNVVLRRVKNTIMLYAKQKKLVGMVADQIFEKQKSNNMMIAILSHIVEFRNGESGLHVLHIHTITELLAKAINTYTDYKLTNEEINLIATASALHDIGKIAIPDNILNKPGRLTPEEFEIMKTHTTEGYKILEHLPFSMEEPLLKYAREICRYHHERYDGRGYPDGLKGDEIPISAQLVSIADVYDALTSERVYKKAFSHAQAVQMIKNGECGTFNPVLLDCFLKISETIRKELRLSSLSSETKEETMNYARNLISDNELTASGRTLELLDKERIKYQFYAKMSEEIHFEYTPEPPMVTISDYGQNKLRIPELIINPKESKELLKIIKEDKLKEFSAILRKTTPTDPIVRFDCELLMGKKWKLCRVIAQSLWSHESTPQFIGAIGKVLDLHKVKKLLTYSDNLNEKGTEK